MMIFDIENFSLRSFTGSSFKENMLLKKWLFTTNEKDIYKEIYQLKKEKSFDDKIKLLKIRVIVENRAKIANILTSLITNIISISAIMGILGYVVNNFKLFKTLHRIGKAKDHLKIVGIEPMGGGFKFIYAGYYSAESKEADQHIMNIVTIITIIIVILLLVYGIYIWSNRYRKILTFIDF